MQRRDRKYNKGVAGGMWHGAWGKGQGADDDATRPQTRRHVAQTLGTWQRQKPEPSNRLWFTIYTYYPSFHPATLSLSSRFCGLIHV